jgi:hypothetical protein
LKQNPQHHQHHFCPRPFSSENGNNRAKSVFATNDKDDLPLLRGSNQHPQHLRAFHRVLQITKEPPADADLIDDINSNNNNNNMKRKSNNISDIYGNRRRTFG